MMWQFAAGIESRGVQTGKREPPWVQSTSQWQPVLPALPEMETEAPGGKVGEPSSLHFAWPPWLLIPMLPARPLS